MITETARRTFDRTKDIPKILGVHSRNVEYHWSIFEQFLTKLPQGSAVLDFGAGSLCETYEMACRGYKVMAIDLNEETLRAYQLDYDWSSVAHQPEIVAGTADTLQGRKFSLITAFDVFEHLEEPSQMLEKMLGLLQPGGFLFCSVPNRRSLFEIMLRINWKVGLARGRVFPAGEPHIQFKSPEEWRAFFSDGTGFRILDHQMAIGFFVNTWAALSSIPAIIVRRLRRRKVRNRDGYGLFASKRVMGVLDALDRKTNKALKGLSAWNLIVLGKL
jgi:2-polyprenyl-3-methyl-5-hydroxy-6-metoxy-1,4-benzoquinol methylase